MSNDLLTKLGEKIQNAVETIELLRLEIGELKAENAVLLEEKEEWDSKLTSLIDQFENLDSQEVEEEEDSDEEDIVDEEDEEEIVAEEDEEEEEIVAEYEEDEDEEDEEDTKPSSRFGRESKSA